MRYQCWLALAGLCGVAACDSPVQPSTPTHTVGGVVSGLAGSGLVLVDNGSETLPVSANGPITFARALAEGENYRVTVRTQPASPAQTCVVSGQRCREHHRHHHGDRGLFHGPGVRLGERRRQPHLWCHHSGRRLLLGRQYRGRARRRHQGVQCRPRSRRRWAHLFGSQRGDLSHLRRDDGGCPVLLGGPVRVADARPRHHSRVPGSGAQPLRR